MSKWETKTFIEEYYMQFYGNKFDNLGKVDVFLEYNLSKLNK